VKKPFRMNRRLLWSVIGFNVFFYSTLNYESGISDCEMDEVLSNDSNSYPILKISGDS
jgi:hypothetical protein